MMKAIWQKESGFTLIELLIVVAIIGILSGIAIPRVKESLATARENACAANVSAIQSAIELYYFQNGNYPTTGVLDFANLTNYLPTAPTCDLGGVYRIDGNGIVTCTHE